MKVTLDNSKASSVIFENVVYDTGVPIEMDFTKAMRLQSKYKVHMELDSAVPYNPQHWQEKRFGFWGSIDDHTGFGLVSYNLIKYSLENGYDVRWLGLLAGDADSVVKSVMNKEIPKDLPMIFHDQPRDYWLETKFPKKIVIIPFETTRIPASWVPKINQMDAIFVPCHQNIGTMANSGVTIPIELIHWGIDETKYYELERDETEFFTFGTMGSLSERKGIDILVDAFSKAFPRDVNDVRLIAKTSNNHFMFWNKDPRIQVDMSPVKHNELLQNFFNQIDCFVYPTRGEGFGLPPLEAMATGVPAITTNWSGPVEYNNDKVGWMLNYSMVPATNFNTKLYKEDCGEWAEPNKDQLIELLRYCYKNRDEVKKKGRLAAEHVKANWLWSNKIKIFHEALDRHL